MARITVVNDYPEFLETMYSILDGLAGHEVAGFNGEETTVEDLVNSNPDLLIVDLRMAGEDMKGWDMLMLARLRPGRRVPSPGQRVHARKAVRSRRRDGRGGARTGREVARLGTR